MTTGFHQTIRAIAACLVALVALQVNSPRATAQPTATVTLTGSAPPAAALANAQLLGRLDPTAKLLMILTLPLRNKADLTDLLNRLYDPADALYGRYLTPQQFDSRFGPTQADYDAVVAYATSAGFTVTKTYSARTMVDITAPASTVAAAFGIHMLSYKAADGRTVYAPDSEPSVPGSISALISGVVGLHNVAIMTPANRHFDNGRSGRPEQVRTTRSVGRRYSLCGSGTGGGMTPTDIRTAYNLDTPGAAALTGTGQTLAVVEFDGYHTSDIQYYESQLFSSSENVTLQNESVDGGSASDFSGDTNGQAEVALDLEMQIALAPGANKIIVYVGPHGNGSNNTNPTPTNYLHVYQQIAADNTATCISTSWFWPESLVDSNTLNMETGL